MPELLQMSLEANEGVVGTAAVFLGVVADPSQLLFAIDGQDYRIEIQGESGSPSGQREQLSSQSIVQGDQLADDPGGEAPEESAQGSLIGKAGEAEQGEKGSVVLQNLGLVDASQSRHGGVQQGQKQIGGKVVGMALRHFDVVLDQPTQSKLVAKTLQQDHPTKVGEMGFDERQTQCSQASGHGSKQSRTSCAASSQTVLKGRFVKYHHYSAVGLKMAHVS